MISFSFYLVHFEGFYIFTPHQHTAMKKSSFNNTSVISSSDHQKTGLHLGSANRCERDFNLNIISLLQQSYTIHYFNQSVLAIVPELIIFVFSNMIIDHILRSALVRFSLLCESYLYNLTWLRFYIFIS